MFAVLRGFVVALLVFVGAACALFWWVLETEPAVQANSAQQLEDADTVKALMQQLQLSSVRRNQTQHVSLYEAQLNSLMGLVQRARPHLGGNVSLREQRGHVAFTWQVWKGASPRYLNVHIAAKDSDGVQLDAVSVGRLPLPANTVLELLVWLADWHTQSDIASQFVSKISQVRFLPEQMVLTLQPVDALLQQLNTIRTGIAGEENEFQRQRVATYLRFLHGLPAASLSSASDLNTFLQPLFERVRRECEAADVCRSMEENQAAILALAVYAGHHRVANLIGAVQPPDQVLLPKRRPTLHGRTDLTQHFLISAALQILAQQGVSSAIGEFKELMDRANGGSGYSFVDLAADMAGISLARWLAQPTVAQDIQRHLASVESSADYFPGIEGLPEGLDKRQFQMTYGNIDSQAYRQQVAQIEQRVNRVPLFQQLRQRQSADPSE
ncbi:hypothetical protein LJ739_16825 [Aestuariibacter halophilus]|uniref:Uncharacterized protein n=1 Tax=Fluctibacter halophilus TaxID=226011 RepID=A0ABS8GDP3_9ALTE|nr:hypothetical protein [Aestuariibacter halophilus]MCC2617919.1 hypothetical protein [Aestuariibacter halophilus]